MAVLIILLLFSILSWAIIFSKWNIFRQARVTNVQFLRAFRKANGFEAVALAGEQFRSSPLVAVFDFGYEEVTRQVKARGGASCRRSLSIRISIVCMMSCRSVRPTPQFPR